MRILHILNGMTKGGAETFIIENMVALGNKVTFDFILRDNFCVFESQINDYGGKVYYSPSFPRHFVKNYFWMRKFFRENINKYDCIHIHANALLYIYPLFLVKKYPSVKVILHSHNTKSNRRFAKIIHFLNRKLFLKNNVIKVACGVEAGRWMFGKKHFIVINNSVSEVKFAFNANYRKEIREKVCIDENTLVIGHVGRFREQKNHTRIIDIFNSLLQKNSNAMLLLVGDGPLKQMIENKVEHLGISKKVVFCGNRDDVYKYYSAFDVLLFPSLYEGLPFSLIEAQMAGCPLIASTAISNEAKITDLVSFIPLSETDDVWSDSLIIASSTTKDRKQYASIVQEMGYGVSYTSEQLMTLYEKGDNNVQ